MKKQSSKKTCFVCGGVLSLVTILFIALNTQASSHTYLVNQAQSATAVFTSLGQSSIVSFLFSVSLVCIPLSVYGWIRKVF